MSVSAPPQSAGTLNFQDVDPEAMKRYMLDIDKDPSIQTFCPKLAARLAGLRLSPLDIANEFHRAVDSCTREPGFNARTVYRLSSQILGTVLTESEVAKVQTHLSK